MLCPLPMSLAIPVQITYTVIHIHICYLCPSLLCRNIRAANKLPFTELVSKPRGIAALKELFSASSDELNRIKDEVLNALFTLANTVIHTCYRVYSCKHSNPQTFIRISSASLILTSPFTLLQPDGAAKVVDPFILLSYICFVFTISQTFLPHVTHPLQTDACTFIIYCTHPLLTDAYMLIIYYKQPLLTDAYHADVFIYYRQPLLNWCVYVYLQILYFQDLFCLLALCPRFWSLVFSYKNLRLMLLVCAPRPRGHNFFTCSAEKTERIISGNLR